MNFRVWPIAALLMACGEPEEVGRTPSPSRVRVDQAHTPRAGGDPLDPRFVGPVEPDALPTVVDAAGRSVPLQALIWWDHPVGWVPLDGDWQPGDYQISAAQGEDLPKPYPFTVGPWGSDELDPNTLVGTAWQVEGGWTALADVVDVALAFTDLVVEVDEVTDDGAIFRLVGDSGQGQCVLLRDEATWEGSVLSWARPAMSVDPGTGVVDAYDLALTLRFDASTPDEAAGQVRGVAESLGLTAALFNDPEEVLLCEIWADSGGACVPCGDGQACIGTSAYGLELVRVDPSGDLPFCGFDQLTVPTLESPVLACEFDWGPIESDCSCASGPGAQGGLPLWFAALTIAFRRRRDPT